MRGGVAHSDFDFLSLFMDNIDVEGENGGSDNTWHECLHVCHPFPLLSHPQKLGFNT